MVYFKLIFIMTDVGNLDKKLKGYFKLSFSKEGNIDAV